MADQKEIVAFLRDSLTNIKGVLSKVDEIERDLDKLVNSKSEENNVLGKTKQLIDSLYEKSCETRNKFYEAIDKDKAKEKDTVSSEYEDALETVNHVAQLTDDEDIFETCDITKTTEDEDVLGNGDNIPQDTNDEHVITTELSDSTNSENNTLVCDATNSETANEKSKEVLKDTEDLDSNDENLVPEGADKSDKCSVNDETNSHSKTKEDETGGTLHIAENENNGIEAEGTDSRSTPPKQISNKATAYKEITQNSAEDTITTGISKKQDNKDNENGEKQKAKKINKSNNNVEVEENRDKDVDVENSGKFTFKFFIIELILKC